MSYERPSWAHSEVPQNLPPTKQINIDVGEFIRTRDALTAAYLGLSASLDRAVKAYLDHTQVVLTGDASLNVSHLIQPFNVLTNHAQMAQMALQQQNGGAAMAPMMLSTGTPGATEEPAEGKKKRKKRAYKPRDPNAPKRPLTAYFRFLGEQRPGIAKEIADNPEVFSTAGKPGDISRVATDRWNALSKDQQEPYRAAYQAALKDYEKEVAKYKAEGGNTDGLDDSKAGITATEPEVQAGAQSAAQPDEDSEESSDESSSDEDEEEAAPPPPPPPPKTTKKAAAKKGKPAETVAPAEVFAPVDPAIPSSTIAAPSSPDRKRRATTEAESGTKKRSRKSGADKEVVAAPDPVPAAATPVPAAPMASSPDAESAAGKKKKDKKKKKT